MQQGTVMKRTLRTVLVLVMVGNLTGGCATGRFARFKGRALQLPVAIYAGMPPPQYPYRNRGLVEGCYQAKDTFFYREHVAYVVSKALELLADDAQAKGANAVIKVEADHDWFGPFCYRGEAVQFDRIPE